MYIRHCPNGILPLSVLAPARLDLGLQVFSRVSINKAPDAREEFARAVLGWQQVLGCYALTGETDFLLHAFFTDMTAFSHFVLDVLLSHTAVLDAHSSFVLKEIKNTTSLPLGHLQPGYAP